MDENNRKSFINEKILGRDMTLQRAIKYAMVSLLCGLLFGLAALGVVAVSRKLDPENKTQEQTLAVQQETGMSESGMPESESAEAVTPVVSAETETEPETETPQTEEADTSDLMETTLPSESDQMDAETAQSLENAEQTGCLDQEELKALVAQQLEERQFTAEDLNELQSLQQEVIEEAAAHLVLVSTTLKETTWFESVVETQRDYAGVVLGKDEKEIQILTVAAAASAEGELYVTFNDGSRQKAVVRKKDVREGLAMLAVSVSGLGSALTETLEPVQLYEGELKTGQPVMTAGAALGAVGSFDFGLVNYLGETEPVVDGSREPVYTRAASDPAAGTFLMTFSGQLIGFARQEDETINASRFVRAQSMSGLLENMKKGNDTAYLGITGSDTSFEMKAENIPEGMLVTGVEDGSPAEQAGIKYGDIIVSIGARQIKGLADYCSFMRNLQPQEESVMTVSRGERGVFQTMEVNITAAGR